MKQKIFWIEKQSDASSLAPTTIGIPIPRDNEVLIKHSAIGINFMDYEYCRGTINLPKVPMIPGIEAVGTIEKLGKDVTKFRLEQRVAYGTAIGGAYTQYRTIEHEYLIPVPDEISDEAVVTNLTKGMTAHYLLRRTFFVRPNMYVLIHGAASGVGQLMIRLLAHYKANVIGTVGSDSKINNVKGCIKVLNYNRDFEKDIWSLTNGQGVNVVYDGIGTNLLQRSIGCMNNFGLLVNFGRALGPMNPFDFDLLSNKSLFLTFPKLQVYKQLNNELILSGMEVFGLIQSKIISDKASKIYDFDELPKALADTEKRKITGCRIAIIK